MFEGLRLVPDEGKCRTNVTAIWSCLKAGDLSLPGPWCPAHSGVSGWRCQSSAAAVAERRLWADRPPPCRRSLTEAVQRGERREGRKEWEAQQKSGWAEADLRRWWGESHPSGSHPTRGAASSLCSWATPVVSNTFGWYHVCCVWC